MIYSDICIIGSSPVGLFAVFEAGILNMTCCIVDGFSEEITFLEKCDPNEEAIREVLLEKINEFCPSFLIGEKMKDIDRNEDGSYLLTTDRNTEVHCKFIVISGDMDNINAFLSDRLQEH